MVRGRESSSVDDCKITFVPIRFELVSMELVSSVLSSLVSECTHKNPKCHF